MATYSNLKDILTQFEKRVVQGNHYTKVQSDENYQLKDGNLSSIAAALSTASAQGLIQVIPGDSSATAVVRVISGETLFNQLFSYNSSTGVLTIIDK